MQIKSAWILLLLVCAGVHAQAPTASAKASPDHPLVQRYEGSEPSSSQVQEFSPYRLVTAVTAEGEFTSLPVAGKLTRMVYLNPDGRSTLEIFENYRQSFSATQFEVLYSCALETCGPTYARSAWNRYNGLFAAADGDPRYLAAKRVAADSTTYVALMVGRRRTQLDIVEVQPMQEDMVVVDASVLGKGLDEAGRASVYGILFDVDLAAIKPESAPALREIARLLQQRPALRLFVVGHTDMTGELAHNQALSAARAKAVVAALVRDHGIAADRLEGYGVGPLAPVASNAGASGRALNRRVELVAR